VLSRPSSVGQQRFISHPRNLPRAATQRRLSRATQGAPPPRRRPRVACIDAAIRIFLLARPTTLSLSRQRRRCPEVASVAQSAIFPSFSKRSSDFRVATGPVPSPPAAPPPSRGAILREITDLIPKGRDASDSAAHSCARRFNSGQLAIRLFENRARLGKIPLSINHDPRSSRISNSHWNARSRSSRPRVIAPLSLSLSLSLSLALALSVFRHFDPSTRARRRREFPRLISGKLGAATLGAAWQIRGNNSPGLYGRHVTQ